MSYSFLLIILIILISPLGCSSRASLAPIIEVTSALDTKPSEHVVAAGETLYSIALRYDMDYKKLSAINAIGYPYAIRPGQRLTLKSGTGKAKARVTEGGVPEARSRELKRSKNQSPLRFESPKASTSAERIKWVWPASGKVLAKFSSNAELNKGIDIQGQLGESVVAAANGLVVYSGSGLRGYGKLIIVKHSEDYLSAYAHNEQIFVREGDLVRAGQLIAKLSERGDGAAVRLHFEIRANGKPVDPLRFLPPR